MPNAFDDAAADLFEDPNLSVAATLVPPAGAERAVRVILSRADDATGLMQTGTIAAVSVAHVLLADAADLAEGWGLRVGDETFEIRKPERDVERTSWRCALRRL